MNMTKITSSGAFFCAFLAFGTLVNPALGQTTNAAPTARPARGQPPARDPHTPGYVAARELPDGEVPPSDADGNFIIGPTHRQAVDTIPMIAGMSGKVFNLTMSSTDSKIYPGIARDPGTFG